MADAMKIIGKISSLSRMKSSVNGNPRFMVAIMKADGTSVAYATQPDASIAYGIENREYSEQDHEWSINGRKHITHATKIK